MIFYSHIVEHVYPGHIEPLVFFSGWIMVEILYFLFLIAQIWCLEVVTK